MQQEVSAALAHRDPDLILSSAFKLRITQRDLATLQEGSWLNDEVKCIGLYVLSYNVSQLYTYVC